MERVIASSILQYLRDNHIITRRQHGFLSKKSTTSNLLEALNDWTIHLTNNQSTDVAYFDFSTAFYIVSHVNFLEKLKAVGITGNLLKWIIDFLSGRSQRTRVLMQ